jgi:pimeloyl-ACP methyl ester carboxylesterase
MSAQSQLTYQPRFVTTTTGSTVALHQCGSRGPSIVAIGGLQAKRMFEIPLGRALAAVADRARVTLIDLPGLGDSRPGGEVTMDTWLTDLSEAYSSMGAGRSIWTGSSMGAWLMLILQERRPEWFHSMCALAPAIDWDLNFPDRMPPPSASPSEMIMVLEGVQLTARLLRSMPRLHVLGRSYSLGCPVHIIHGARDQYDGKGLVASFASRLGPGCTLELLDDDHSVAKLRSASSLEAFTRWIRKELERVSAIS